MAVSDIKNTFLRRLVCILLAPTAILLAVLLHMVASGVEAFLEMAKAIRDAWRGS